MTTTITYTHKGHGTFSVTRPERGQAFRDMRAVLLAYAVERGLCRNWFRVDEMQVLDSERDTGGSACQKGPASTTRRAP